jgi:glycosyltransferase involved in cell wall biosynthesis
MPADLSFAILIPCYNSARYIRQAIEAAIHQTHSADEIIIVDDKSTDESLAIIRDLPVQVICQEVNRGPAAARNTALHAATSDIVIFIDSDALADPHLIEAFDSAYLRASPSVAGIGGCGIEANIQTIYDTWRSHHSVLNYGPVNRRNVNYLYGICASYHREVLLKIGGFDPYFRASAGEEIDLGYRLRKAGYRLDYYADAKVYHQRADDLDALVNTQSKYFYWAYLEKKRNHQSPWMLFFGILRRLFTDPLSDLIVHRDINQARISLLMFYIKMNALVKAAQSKQVEFNK